MVHAYLMYGFPTQTAQETVDSLEVVRQIFKHGIVQSGFWHLFTMTAHSVIGLNPEQFNVKKKFAAIGQFANNDIEHIDEKGTKHEKYSEGLKKSLFNYMHKQCFDYPLRDWFDFKISETKVPKNYIRDILQHVEISEVNLNSKIIWLGVSPELKFFTKNKKGKVFEMAELLFYDRKNNFSIKLNHKIGQWLCELLPTLSVYNKTYLRVKEVKDSFNSNELGDFDAFFYGRSIKQLRKHGLLLL
jgi:hypothetical protein